MALAVNRSGTILKKCGTANHRPDSNKRCAARLPAYVRRPGPLRPCLDPALLGQRQAGGEVLPGQEAPRHQARGLRQREEACRDWQLRLTVDKRSGDLTFADHGRTGKQNFGEACEQFIARMAVNGNTRLLYDRAYRTHVTPLFGDRTLAQVAQDRDGVTDLLTLTMGHLSNSPASRCACSSSAPATRRSRRAGWRHNLADIGLARPRPEEPAC